MPEPKPELQQFFAGMSDLLLFRQSVTDLEAQVGLSASGTQRLDFYRILAERSRLLLLRQLFPVLRHATQQLAEQSQAVGERTITWRELMLGYVATHPPTHYDPNRLGEGLADYLHGLEGAHPFLEELADFEYCLWAVGVSPHEPTAQDPGLDRTLFVRLYDHDLANYVARVREGTPAQISHQQTHVLIHRDLHTGHPSHFLPTPLGLAALAQRLGAQQRLIDDNAALLDAERQLETHGVLLARAGR
ncbi:MAG: hypothetical protein AB7K71_38640 [Polyangiaceae bacterium]